LNSVPSKGDQTNASAGLPGRAEGAALLPAASFGSRSAAFSFSCHPVAQACRTSPAIAAPFSNPVAERAQAAIHRASVPLLRRRTGIGWTSRNTPDS